MNLSVLAIVLIVIFACNTEGGNLNQNQKAGYVYNIDNLKSIQRNDLKNALVYTIPLGKYSLLSLAKEISNLFVSRIVFASKDLSESQCPVCLENFKPFDVLIIIHYDPENKESTIESIYNHAHVHHLICVRSVMQISFIQKKAELRCPICRKLEAYEIPDLSCFAPGKVLGRFFSVEKRIAEKSAEEKVFVKPADTLQSVLNSTNRSSLIFHSPLAIFMLLTKVTSEDDFNLLYDHLPKSSTILLWKEIMKADSIFSSILPPIKYIESFISRFCYDCFEFKDYDYKILYDSVLMHFEFYKPYAGQEIKKIIDFFNILSTLVFRPESCFKTYKNKEGIEKIFKSLANPEYFYIEKMFRKYLWASEMMPVMFGLSTNVRLDLTEYTNLRFENDVIVADNASETELKIVYLCLKTLKDLQGLKISVISSFRNFADIHFENLLNVLKRLKSLTVLGIELYLNADELLQLLKSINLTRLEYLDLSTNVVGTEATSILITNLQKANFTFFAVRNCQLSENNLTSLLDQPFLQEALQHLIISSNNISKDGTMALFQVLKNANSCLRVIEIENISMTDNDLNEFFEILKSFKQLRALNISGIKNLSVALKTFCELLHDSPYIRWLLLTDTGLNDKSFKKINDYLKFNGLLQHLDISRNHLTSKGWKYLKDYMNEDTNLNSVDVSRNKILIDDNDPHIGNISLSESIYVIADAQQVGTSGNLEQKKRFYYNRKY